MYTYLTSYDSTRHLASLARRGAFDPTEASDDLRPIARHRLHTISRAAIARLRHHRIPVGAPLTTSSSLVSTAPAA